MTHAKSHIIISIILTFLLTGCGVDYHFKNAERLKNEGKYQEAITKYKKIIGKYPTSEFAATSQFTIANIYFYKLKDYNSAKTEYEYFIRKFPDNLMNSKAQKIITQIDEINSYLTSAKQNLENQKIKDVIKEFQYVLEIDPDCPQAKQGLEQARQEEIIEVKTGKFILCEDCGKVLKRNVRTIKVKRKNSGNYNVSKIRQGVCSSCSSTRRKKTLESEIVEYAKKFREVRRKYYNIQYELNYRTPSSEIYSKSAEFQRFAEREYAPVGMHFSNLLVEYSQQYGGMALRDLAIKYNFLDLLR